MKKFLAIVAIASFAVACNNSSDSKATTDSTATVVDSTIKAVDSTVKVVDSTVKAVDSTVKADSVKK